MTDEQSVAESDTSVKPQLYDTPAMWIQSSIPVTCVVDVCCVEQFAPYVRLRLGEFFKVNLSPDAAQRLASDLRDAVTDIQAQAAIDEAKLTNPYATPEINAAMVAGLQAEVGA